MIDRDLSKIYYGNWVIGTFIGACLFYRNIGLDRMYGIFLMLISQIQLVMYSLHNKGDSKSHIRLIPIIIAITLFSMGLAGFSCHLNSYYCYMLIIMGIISLVMFFTLGFDNLMAVIVSFIFMILAVVILFVSYDGAFAIMSIGFLMLMFLFSDNMLVISAFPIIMGIILWTYNLYDDKIL